MWARSDEDFFEDSGMTAAEARRAAAEFRAGVKGDGRCGGLVAVRCSLCGEVTHRPLPNGRTYLVSYCTASGRHGRLYRCSEREV